MAFMKTIADPKDTLPTPTAPVATINVSNIAPPLDIFQRIVLLMENMNALKHHINLEEQVCHDNPSHMAPVSDDEEELEIPMNSVPITQPENDLPGSPSAPSPEFMTQPFSSMLVDGMHIPSLDASPSPPVATTPALMPTTLTPWTGLCSLTKSRLVSSHLSLLCHTLKPPYLPLMMLLSPSLQSLHH